MKGNTRMGNRQNPGVNNDFNAWYGLISHAFDSHRITLRYDQFEVLDLDHVFPFINEDGEEVNDDNNSHGKAITVAYLFHATDFQIIGIEYLGIDSQRNDNGIYPDDPDDDLLQLMIRLMF